MQMGSRVAVKVFGNKEVKRIVVEVLRDSVTVTDEVEFTKIQRGERAIWPVAVPLSDVKELATLE